MEMNDIPKELFVNISNEDWEWKPIVCVEHKKYLPCRYCLYDTVTTVPYSSKPEDIQAVRKYQQGE